MNGKEDFIKFTYLLEEISDCYKDCNFSANNNRKALSYWNALKGWKIDIVEKGIKLMLERRQFSNCPTPGEINRYIELINII